MLQRAASNAYSWWWASHVRTKQSKWLEQSLADMEERVSETLKIVAHDGDSFAKRAEMYYRRRPEIISFVEDSFKAYRSLAEKYDHLSRELQSANRTIAQVFPEKVQFALDEEDESSAQETPRKASKAQRKDKKSLTTKGKQLKRSSTSAGFATSQSSGMGKGEALEEIDKLQKTILGLQTQKEFVRGVYENAATKYWDMENQIDQMQTRISSLQDEYGIGNVIEDGEARSLMATTALNSCKQTLQKLQEKRELTSEDAKTEETRIKEAYYQLETLKDEFLTKYLDNQKECTEKTQTPPEYSEMSLERSSPDSITGPEQEKQNSAMVMQKNKENIVASSDKDLSVMELSEKIDELVTKVVKQETSVTSQDTLVKRLTSETDEIKGHIQELKGEKENLTQSSETMKKKIEELEDELGRVRNLKQTVEDQNTNLQTQFTEASCDIEDLSGQMHTVKLDEDLEDADTLSTKEPNKLEERDNPETAQDEKKKDDVSVSGDSEKSSERDVDSVSHGEGSEEETVPAWRLLCLDTLDDRERNLLEEYSSVLQNYKDVRKKLNEAEERNRESIHDLTMQMRELVKSNAMRDAEIVALRQQLDTQQTDQEDHSTISSPGHYYSPLDNTGESRSKVDGSPIVSVISSLGTESSNEDARNDDLNASTSLAEKKESGHTGERIAISTCQEKIQKKIDHLLEENLEFWLRFSNSIQQKRKFQATIQDLKAELLKVQVRNKRLNSDAKPIYRHLREIHTELKIWLGQSAVLRDEVQGRFSYLSHLQDEISEACSGSGDGNVQDTELTQNQAAKFHGEVLTMKQENTRIEKELQICLGRVKGLQLEVQNLLEKLDGELGMSSPKGAIQPSRPRIPLHSFLFGVKLKKKRQQKRSLFSCVGAPTTPHSPTVNH